MAKKIIQLFSNSVGLDEIQEIIKVYSSRWLGYGDQSKKFEKEFANAIGSKYALGLNSATAGLFLSMDVLGIGKGDEVILPTVNFIGCANAILKSGAKPVFADVDPITLNILPSEIERLKNKKTRAVMIIHYAGQMSDIDGIRKTLNYRGRKIELVEDSANSVYSTYKGKFAGTFGTLGIFSFDAMKILVTGDGGMITMQKEDVHRKTIEWRYLGMKSRLASGFTASQLVSNWWKVEANVPGNRYTINDTTSAVGRVQLKKLKGFIGRRKRIWDIYKSELKNVEALALPPEPAPKTTSSYYMFWIRAKTEEARNKLAWTLKENSIYSSFRYYPLHMVPFFKHRGRLKNSEEVAKTTLNIPLHQNLSDNDILKVVSVVKSWGKKF